MKVLLSALWVALLFVFAYVEMFRFFRADVLNAALQGEVSGTGLAINQVCAPVAVCTTSVDGAHDDPGEVR